MHVVIAPDKFKGTLTALEVAEAMAVGVRRYLTTASIQLRPLADGGEGMVQALCTGVGGRVEERVVTGPLGGKAVAQVGWLNDGRAVIEMASASGLAVLGSQPPDSLAGSSRGTGELIRYMVEGREFADVIVGIGGSASTDGGTGAATALGWRFLDARGRDLPSGGGSLGELARIDGTRALAMSRAHIVGACDVTNPLVGPEGSPRIYAPQKGAGPEQVARLEDGIQNLAQRIDEDLGIDIATLEGGGSGGGMGAGLVAFFGGSLRSGFDVVAEIVGLEEALGEADLVLTGEGKLDAQTMAGKVPAGVAGAARKAGVKCAAVAGTVELPASKLKKLGIAAAVSLTERRADEDDAPTATAEAAVSRATERLLALIFEKRTRRRDRIPGLVERRL